MKFNVVIDPGHGGKDSGALGTFSKEKDLNLLYAKELMAILNNDQRFESSLTRTSDIYISLKDRAALATGREASVFISVHCNASVSKLPNDVQVYYYNEQKDKPLAEAIFSLTDKVDGMTSKWSRTIFGNFSVLRNLDESNIPACLVEVGFITNDKDEKLLNDEKFMKDFCNGMAHGLRSFILLS